MLTDFPANIHDVARPPGLGRVFYVHGFNGLDTNNGLDPGTPFRTIAYALLQCANGRNDYIIVLNHWHEAMPIQINITRVHIIGLGFPSLPQIAMSVDGVDTDIFEIMGNLGDMAEIAGFDLGGGVTHAGIEFGGLGVADGVYIHDCNFGSPYCGDTPLYGIWSAGAGHGRSGLIERCTFMGAGDGGAGGTITGDGIRHEMWQTEIRHNIFLGIPGVAIYQDGCNSVKIIENFIMVDADTQGAGITFGAGSDRNLIAGNRAAFRLAQGALTNPYLDIAAANRNAWVGNYWSEALAAPA